MKTLFFLLYVIFKILVFALAYEHFFIKLGELFFQLVKTCHPYRDFKALALLCELDEFLRFLGLYP